MRWSKRRKLVEESFAPSVRGRVRVFSTHYSCSCGYASIVADGKQIAEFNTRLHFANVDWVSDEENPGWARKIVQPIEASERSKYPLSVPREFSRFDFNESCWQLLHTNPHAALEADDPMLAALAVLHRKVGVGRVRSLRDRDIHPLVRWAVEFRLDAQSTHKASP
ncbi:hypothetical protein AYO38_01230 [bacterium SCGC AG-212-C10]|nr:hypothetical protein AYO38_01230 [bacterium SCGC AG-212-C10]